jgi:3',5'-nucleoside bisphosphate phosphatase
MTYTDMHIHTIESDGEYTSQEIFEKAASKNIEAICISDHDSFEHFEEIKDLSKSYNIRTMPAVEVSTVYQDKEIHILAYGVKKQHKMFNQQLEKIRQSRDERAMMIVEKLKSYYNVEIEFENVKKRANSNLGRPHIAKELVEKGYATDINDAFDKFLGQHSKAHVAKYKVDTLRAFQMIKYAGGLSFIAHIGRYYSIKMLDVFRKNGLTGIELYHPSHTVEIKKNLKKYAKRHNMMLSGGSDFHSEGINYGRLGSQDVPISIFNDIETAVKEIAIG